MRSHDDEASQSPGQLQGSAGVSAGSSLLQAASSVRGAALIAWAFSALLGAGVLAVALSWPGAAHLGTRVIGDGGDGPQFLWNLWWVHGWLEGRHGLFFTRLLLWPIGANLAWATLALPSGVLASVLLGLGASLVAAYNLVALALVAANGLAAVWCARHVGLSRAASLVAGALFESSPYVLGQLLGHLNLVGAFGLPLVVGWGWDLLRRERPAWWRFALLGLLVALTTYQADDYGVYSVLALAIVWLVHPDLGGRRLSVLRWWPRWGLAVVCAVLALAPMLWSLEFGPLAVHAAAATPFATPYLVDALSWFVPDPWGAFAWLAPFWHLAPDIADGSGFPGFGLWAGLVVLVAGLWWANRRRRAADVAELRRLGVPLAVAAAASGLLSMGPYLHVDGIRTPVPLPGLLAAVVPFYRDTLPERVAVLTALFGSLMAAWALAWLWRRLTGHPGWQGLLVAVVALVSWVGSEPLPFADTALPMLPRARAVRAIGGSTLWVPVAIPNTVWGTGITLYMAEAARTQTPTPEGYVARLPRVTQQRIAQQAVLAYLWGVAQAPNPEAGLAARAAAALPGFLAVDDVCSIVLDTKIVADPEGTWRWLRAHTGPGWRALERTPTWWVLVRPACHGVGSVVRAARVLGGR